KCNKKKQKTTLLRHFSNDCYQTDLIIVSQLEFNVSTTSTHTCSESFCKVFMSLLMGSRGKSSHINFNATFNSLIVFGFGHRLWYFSSIAPLHDNPFVGVRTDFGLSLPLRRSRADPLSSMRSIFFNGRPTQLPLFIRASGV